MNTTRVTLIFLSVCVFTNGYGLSDNGKGNNSTKTGISLVQPKQDTEIAYSTKNVVADRQLTTPIPANNDNSINVNKLKSEISELQKMQETLLRDMAGGHTSARKQRLLRQIEQQIRVRISRQKQLETAAESQKVQNAKQQKVKTIQDQQKQRRQQVQQLPPPLKLQEKLHKPPQPILSQVHRSQGKQLQEQKQQQQQQQTPQQGSQLLQVLQHPPSLQIPPLIPQNLVQPHQLQQQNQSVRAPQILVPMNSLSLGQVLQGHNQRYIVLGSAANIGNKPVQLSEFMSSPARVSTPEPPVSTTTPTIKTTQAPTTEEATVATTTSSTESSQEDDQGPMLDMDFLRMSYYEDSITKQKLEITKLRLEIRALERTEMQNMRKMGGAGGGENENEDAPPLRSMFGPRRMPFPMPMPMFR